MDHSVRANDLSLGETYEWRQPGQSSSTVRFVGPIRHPAPDTEFAGGDGLETFPKSEAQIHCEVYILPSGPKRTVPLSELYPYG